MQTLGLSFWRWSCRDSIHTDTLPTVSPVELEQCWCFFFRYKIPINHAPNEHDVLGLLHCQLYIHLIYSEPFIYCPSTQFMIPTLATCDLLQGTSKDTALSRLWNGKLLIRSQLIWFSFKRAGKYWLQVEFLILPKQMLGQFWGRCVAEESGEDITSSSRKFC